MIAHYAHRLPALLGADAVTLGQHVYFRSAEPSSHLVRHEAKHTEQFAKLGLVRFLARYVREYLAGRLQGLSHNQAYLNISLEREAREAEYGSR